MNGGSGPPRHGMVTLVTSLLQWFPRAAPPLWLPVVLWLLVAAYTCVALACGTLPCLFSGGASGVFEPTCLFFIHIANAN